MKARVFLKNIIAFFLSAITVFASAFLISVSCSAANVSGDYEYTVSGGKATITKYTGVEQNLNLPSELDGYPVVYISGNGKKTFIQNALCVKKVVIPAGVTTINDYAFSGSNGLEEVILPASVKTVGQYAFNNCTSLSTITLLDGITKIYSNSFYNTEYYNNKNNWENNILYVGKYLIKAKNTLTGSVTVRNQTVAIAESAFYGCEGITDITLPEGIKELLANTFYSCVSMTEINIPSSVTAIRDAAFYGCNKLKKVKTENLSAWCRIAFYNDDANPLKYSHCLYLNGQPVKRLEIPDDIVNIKGASFEECSAIKELVISQNVNTVAVSAFNGCSGLESITVNPDNASFYSEGNCIIRKKDKAVVLGCKNTVIPNDRSVLAINDAAFYQCTGLKSIVIPDGVKTIGTSAFFGCSGLESALLGCDIETINNYAFSECIVLTDINIPDSVVKIGNNALSGCVSLNELEIPYGVEQIGNYAFYYCTGLGEIILPDSLAVLGKNAFDSCSALESVNLGSGISTVSDYIFRKCGNLKSVRINDSVTKINSYAFLNCDKLSSVYYGGTQEQWQNITVSLGNDRLNNVSLYYESLISVFGDLNKDGFVNAADILILKQRLLKSYSADITKDNKTDISDLIRLKKIAASV